MSLADGTAWEKEHPVVLTDYPKSKHISAHMRGVETEELLEILKRLFHGMMSVEMIEAGGYVIEYDYRQIQEELAFRNVRYEL